MRNLIDFWSIPHLLFGVVAALAGVAFMLPFWPTFLATFVIAILWEILESRFQVGEISWNIGSDIALPLIMFPPTFLLASRPEIGIEHRVFLLVIAFSLYAYTNAIAWHARLDGDPDFKI